MPNNRMLILKLNDDLVNVSGLRVEMQTCGLRNTYYDKLWSIDTADVQRRTNRTAQTTASQFIFKSPTQSSALRDLESIFVSLHSTWFE
jgi:hypothetical protein